MKQTVAALYFIYNIKADSPSSNVSILNEGQDCLQSLLLCNGITVCDKFFHKRSELVEFWRALICDLGKVFGAFLIAIQSGLP